MNKEHILNFLKVHKEELKKNYDLLEIGLFGSYAQGKENDNSDIDIVIKSIKKDFFTRDDLREYLEMHFERPVDVGYIESIRDYYKKKIEKDIIYV